MSRAALPAPALAVVVVAATALARRWEGRVEQQRFPAQWWPPSTRCSSSSSSWPVTVSGSLNLTAPGVEPHDLELKPRQVAELADADLVVYESRLQPAVDDAVKQNAERPRSRRRRCGRPAGSSNLHFWLDPVRLATAATAIEKRLVRVDPGDRSALAGNLARLLDTLSTLDHEFATGLSRCVRDVIVTSHSAFGYWSRYGVRTEAIAGLSPDAEPSASRLDELRSLVDTRSPHHRLQRDAGQPEDRRGARPRPRCQHSGPRSDRGPRRGQHRRLRVDHAREPRSPPEGERMHGESMTTHPTRPVIEVSGGAVSLSRPAHPARHRPDRGDRGGGRAARCERLGEVDAGQDDRRAAADVVGAGAAVRHTPRPSSRRGAGSATCRSARPSPRACRPPSAKWSARAGLPGEGRSGSPVATTGAPYARPWTPSASASARTTRWPPCPEASSNEC